MKLIFAPAFRYLWSALAVLTCLTFVLLRDVVKIPIEQLPFGIEFILGLTCLFLFLTMVSREKVEDERLTMLRGKSFAQALFIGVLFGLYCSFFPSEGAAVFQSSAAMMLYMQASFLLNFHSRKRKDQ